MRIVWQRRALADIRAIRRFLRPRNAAAAERVLQRIRERVDALAIFPLASPALQDVPMRRLVVTRTPYIVYYTVRGENIVIEAVFHRAQDRPI